MKFWVDMDNAPHVHVLNPVIKELERRGHQVRVTARDYGQTLPLLDMYGLEATRVGRHGGRNIVRKVLSFVGRSAALYAYALGKGFDAALSHGSRSIIPAARLLGIPIISMGDYEHTSLPAFMASWISLVLTPDVLPPEALARLGVRPGRVSGYPGLKEDLYVHDFTPDAGFRAELGIDPASVLVLVRPPATMAHYAVARSAVVFGELLDHLCGRREVQVLLLPRTPDQAAELRALAARRGYASLIFPARVYNGPNLIWYSDLVISGGGTMNREAAALGVPVYSVYQGPIGAVDRWLIQQGRLVHVRDMDGIRRIPLVKSRERSLDALRRGGARACGFVVDRIEEVACGLPVGALAMKTDGAVERR